VPLTTDHRDRHLLQVLLALLRRDDDLLEAAGGGAGLLRVGRGRGGERGDDGEGDRAQGVAGRAGVHLAFSPRTVLDVLHRGRRAARIPDADDGNTRILCLTTLI